MGWGDGGGGGVTAFNWCKREWAVATQKEGGRGRKVATGGGEGAGCCGGNPHVNDLESGCITISSRRGRSV